MRKLLDKMFANKKLSLVIPMTIAFLMYLLFVFFGNAEDRISLLIVTPILSVLCFFGVSLGIFVQVKNPLCPKWFANLFELLAAIAFGMDAIVGVVSFAVSGFQNYHIGTCLALIGYSAISWVHSKRTK